MKGYQMILLVNSGVRFPSVGFPVLGWVPLMLVGLAFGRRVAAQPARAARLAWQAVALCVGVFFVTHLTHLDSDPPWTEKQGIEGFLLLRKGPPAVDFFAFNLAFGLAALAAFLSGAVDLARAPWRWLVVYGRASLFLFAAHLLVAFVVARVALYFHVGPDWLRYTLVVSVAAALLVPMAAWYRRAKERHRGSLLRYL